MPVAHDETELKNFIKEENRIDEASKRLTEIKEKWSVEKSIEEYKDLLHELHKTIRRDNA